MKRAELRNKLFAKYFKNEEGISLKEFLTELQPVIEKYQKLQAILLKNGEDYKKFFKIKKIKKIFYQNKEYLIIKTRVSTYFIIDINNNKSLTEFEAKNIFAEEIFIDNFDEREGYYRFYTFLKYNGNVEELIRFYTDNEQYFSLNTIIRIRVEEDCAWSYISIDLAGDAVQLGFRTENQFLYESLFLDASLVPSPFQDAGQKLGVECMKEIFSKIGDIIIPQNIITKYPIINQEKSLIRKRVNASALPINNGKQIYGKK